MPAVGESSPDAAAPVSAGAEEAAPPTPTRALANAPPDRPADAADLLHVRGSALHNQAAALAVRAARAAQLAENALARTRRAERSTEDASAKNIAALAELRHLLTETAAYKKAAWRAHQATSQLLAEVKTAAEAAAERVTSQAGEEEEQRLKEETALANRKATEYDAVYSSPEEDGSSPEENKSEPARGATAPYERAKQRAQTIRAQYAERARAESERAQTAHEDARMSLKVSLEHQIGGLGTAQRLYDKAKRMFARAQTLQKQAAADRAQAEAIAKTVPTYDANIAHAELVADWK